MPSSHPSSAPESVAIEVVSTLRHDLVAPINLIVGYCDLLMGEATDSGRTSRVTPLRSIRSLGYTLLSLIDQVLLSDEPTVTAPTLADLASSLEAPASQVVQSCDLLRSATTSDADSTEFTDDLAKIEFAGRQMLILARDLARKSQPTDGRTDPLGSL